MTADGTSSGSAPLDGVRVLDFTHGVAGPYATMLLADLGCEVTKIERPGRGDPTRYMNVSPRFVGGIPESGGDYFMAINRNKRSVTLDLKKTEGVELARRLARVSDVVVQNFRPGVMERLGLGTAALRADNPRLVHASLSAYGKQGPLAHQPGMDVAIQARSGVMSITGPVGSDEPVKPAVSMADFAGGVHLALAVMAALLARSRTDRGDEVHVSLLDATMSMLSNYSVAVMDGEVEFAPLGSGHPQLVPFEAVRAKDGHLVIAPGTNRLFRTLCDVLGREDLAQDERYASNESRVVHRDQLMRDLSGEFQRQTVSEWLRTLEDAGVPCAPVSTMREAFADPQLHSNGMVAQVPHPGVGMVSLLGSPYQFAAGQCAIRMAPPMLGQHTAEVLSSVLSLGEPELERLREAGVI